MWRNVLKLKGKVEIKEEVRYYKFQGEYVDEYKTYKYDYTITKTAEEDRAIVATMRNSAFCVGQPTTFVYYNTNNITVYYNGSASGNVSTYASYGCSSWLSYSTALI